jgi:hypothetical protein
VSDLEARLRDKYPDDALERLVRSNYEYYSTHGDYVPELAKLLLLERAERDRLREALDLIVRGCELAAGPERYARIAEIGRAALAGSAPRSLTEPEEGK